MYKQKDKAKNQRKKVARNAVPSGGGETENHLASPRFIFKLFQLYYLILTISAIREIVNILFQKNELLFYMTTFFVG